MKRVFLILLTLSCLLTTHTHGTELHGSYKNVLSYTDTSKNSKRLGLTSENSSWETDQRFALDVTARPSASWQLQANYELRLGWGERTRIQNRQSPFEFRKRFFHLENNFEQESNRLGTHAMDQLYARYQSPNWQWTFGRQPVTWGTGFLWNPADLFTNFAPNEIDRDTKPSVDVIRTIYYLDTDTSIDLIGEPLDLNDTMQLRASDSSLAMRAKTHFRESDLSGIVGRIQGDTVIGGDWASYLADAGWHGEWTYTLAKEVGQQDFFKGVLGIDYSFKTPGELYQALEYFYNGLGTHQPETYVTHRNRPAVTRAFERGTAYNLGVHYMGWTVRVVPSALVTLQHTLYWNVGDKSLLFYPSLQFSLTQNTTITLGLNHGVGPQNSEFGSTILPPLNTEIRYPTTAFAYLKYFF